MIVFRATDANDDLEEDRPCSCCACRLDALILHGKHMLAHPPEGESKAALAKLEAAIEIASDALEELLDRNEFNDDDDYEIGDLVELITPPPPGLPPTRH